MQLTCYDQDGKRVIDGPLSHCIGELLKLCSTVEIDDLRKHFKEERNRAVLDEKRFPMPAVPVPADPTPVIPPSAEYAWMEQFDLDEVR